MNISGLTERNRDIRDRGIKYFLPDNKIACKSYAELHVDVESLRQTLQSWGIEAGSRVGIMANNCYEWIVLDLALIDLGAISVCLPIAEFEKKSLQELGETYEVDILLCGPGIRTEETLPPWCARFANGTWEKPAEVRSVARQVSMPREDVFSLVFSSGTSGLVKCLPISRDGTQAWVAAYGRHYTFQTDDRMLIVLPLSNYQQRVMIYTAMWYRFEVLLAQPATLFRALKEMRPTIIIGPPLFYEAVENRYRTLSKRQQTLVQIAGRAIAALPSDSAKHWLRRRLFAQFHDAFGGQTRLMLSGGAPNRLSTLELFELLGLPLFQAYGLTETGVISWNLPGANRIGSVGKPVFPDAVSLAEDGEILVKQKHPQSYGYLYCDEEVVKKVFIDDDTVATGDIGRIDDDGYLYIIGRKKQIIITQGGFKVHPESLERELEKSEWVSRAVVFGGGELTGLVALISLRSVPSNQVKEVEETVKRVVEQVNGSLPSQSRISRTEFTDTQFTIENGLLTRNLKLDRDAIYRKYRVQLLQHAG